MALSQMLHPTKRMTMSWRLGLLSLAVMFAGPLQAATTHDQRYTALARSPSFRLYLQARPLPVGSDQCLCQAVWHAKALGR